MVMVELRSTISKGMSQTMKVIKLGRLTPISKWVGLSPK